MKATCLDLLYIKREGVKTTIFYPYTAVALAVTHALTPLFDVGEFQHKVTAINLCVGKIPEMELLHALCCMFCTLACCLLMK